MATFASLRTLHALIGDALDDVERIFASYQPPVCSPTGSESSGSAQYSSPRASENGEPTRAPLDFPSLDESYDPLSPAEALLSHPTVVHATKLIVSATGQLAAMVQRPFLTICDATMGVSYHIYPMSLGITFAVSIICHHACAFSRLHTLWRLCAKQDLLDCAFRTSLLGPVAIPINLVGFRLVLLAINR